MSSPAAPAETRAYIVERLVGEIGEPGPVMDAARALAERSLPAIHKSVGEALGTPITMEIARVELARFADVRKLAEGNTAMSVVSSASSPDALLMILDAPAVGVAIAALFGGDPDAVPVPIERPLSPTEIEVATMLFATVAAVLNGSGSRGLSLNLPLALPLVAEALRKYVVRDGPAVLIEIALGNPANPGKLMLMMPQRVLLKHRRQAANTQDGADMGWSERFGAEIRRSAVTLEATMPLGSMTLGQISTLASGQIIEFPEHAKTQAKLSARDKTLFVCEFGKLGQNYTVRINHAFDTRQELIDGLTPS